VSGGLGAEEREERRSAWTFSATDRIVTLVFILIVLAILVFAYFYYLENRRFLTCQSNLMRINTALQLYMQDTEGKLPPLYVRARDGEVALDAAGLPRTWIVVAVPRVNSMDVFRCPSAPDSHHTLVTDPRPIPDAGTIQLTYGMVASMGAVDKETVRLPGSTALMAETIRGGRGSSFDPLPLAGGNDGFIVGFDDSNEGRTPESVRATRLAVRRDDRSKGWVPGNVLARHTRRGLNVLFVDGHVQPLSPDMMFLNQLGMEHQPLWGYPIQE
jgi:prepilin-type processing-associated H-X9-DG protein